MKIINFITKPLTDDHVLPTHPFFGAFDSFTEEVPLAVVFKCAFSASRRSHNLHEVHLNLVDDYLVVLSKKKFQTTINLRIFPSSKFYTPSSTDVFFTLYQIGYQTNRKGVGEL